MISIKMQMTFMGFEKNEVVKRGPDWEFSLGFINFKQVDIQSDIQWNDLAGKRNL